MTIASETSRVDLVGDGVNDTFTFTFEIYVKTDLLVYVDEELQAVDVNYTVADEAIENPDGGDIVFGAEYIPALDAVVSIILNLPYTQLIDYVETDKFPAETHERGLDRLVKIVQQHKEKLSRTPSLAISSALSNLTIPEAAARVIGWDALAEELTTYPITPVLDANWDSIQNYDNDLATAVATIGGGAKTLLIDVSTESVIANLEVPETLELYPTRTGVITVDNCILTINRLSEAVGPHKIFNCINGGTVVFGSGAVKEVYPQWWGNNTTPGTTDMTAEIQAAIDVAEAMGGGIVWFSGTAYYVTSTLIHDSSSSILQGSGPKTIIKGSGITILQIGIVGNNPTRLQATVRDMMIQDDVGHADTIGILVENTTPADGEGNWRIENVSVVGTDAKGTGIKTNFGLKGVLDGCVVQYWEKNIHLADIDGAHRSNANWIHGVKSRVGTYGFYIDGADNAFLSGCTAEGNSTGLLIDDSKVMVHLSHFENNLGEKKNVEVTSGSYISVSNFYGGGGSTYKDIYITGGGNEHLSIGDTLNNGINHSGTGVVNIFAPIVSVTKSGTGPIIEHRNSGIRATNRTAHAYIIDGFANLTVGQPILKLKTQPGTPDEITGDQNDYDLGTSGIRRLSSDAARTITGFVAGSDGDLVLLINVGAENIVLADQNAGSAAANRIITGTGANVTLLPDDTAWILYDATTVRWRITNTY